MNESKYNVNYYDSDIWTWIKIGLAIAATVTIFTLMYYYWGEISTHFIYVKDIVYHFFFGSKPDADSKPSDTNIHSTYPSNDDIGDKTPINAPSMLPAMSENTHHNLDPW